MPRRPNRPRSPAPSSSDAMNRMRRQRRRDTNLELAIRREVHRRGLRYRVDQGVLKGSRRRHDMVFTAARVVVDIRGCYWHACPDHATTPKANSEWWSTKLATNARRDADTESALTSAGWTVLVVWEHDDVVTAADRIEAEVRSRRS